MSVITNVSYLDYMKCLTLSSTSDLFASLNRSNVPTKYPVTRLILSNLIPTPISPFLLGFSLDLFIYI